MKENSRLHISHAGATFCLILTGLQPILSGNAGGAENLSALCPHYFRRRFRHHPSGLYPSVCNELGKVHRSK